MAMKVRQEAAKQNPLAALMDVVVGYFSYRHFSNLDYPYENHDDDRRKEMNHHGSNFGGVFIVLLSDIGLRGGFASIEPLVSHALSLGRMNQ